MNPRAPFQPDFLHEHLVANGPYAQVKVVHTTGSTNSDVIALAQQGCPAFTALLAEHQSAGRGRMGRSYTSPAYAQIPLSVLIRPSQAAIERLGTMPLAAGLALIDALPPASQVGLKWPNDMQRNGKKLCGILAEAVSLGEHPAVVIGLGLNTDIQAAELPVPHATSLSLEGIAFDRNDLAVKILQALHTRLSQWEADDPALLDDYRAVSTTIGQDVKVLLPDHTELLGHATGIADDGRLIVRDAAGQSHILSAGDVTHLRLQ